MSSVAPRLAPSVEASTLETGWRALRYFNLYRLTIAGLFVALLWRDTLPPPLGSHDERLFSIVAWLYFGLAVLAQVAVEDRRRRFGRQVFAQVALDIVAITLMMYASGGVSSGMGMLLVVAIAGGSILTAGRTAVLFAALASVAVLIEEIYSWALFYFPAANYTQAGLLGGAFFATALLSYVFARRIRDSEALAVQRGIDLANLAQLNEHIVQRMQSGIVVLSSDRRVRLMNEAAMRLLAIDENPIGKYLQDLVPDLARHHDQWVADGRNSLQPLRPSPGETEIIVSYTSLGGAEAPGTLVFIEDAAITRQRAQQMKLVSLGRLTASIAHEIRNPLGAISHAGQLLSESADLNSGDQRLTRIIGEHAERVNRIIENVLRLGSRESAIPESFMLKPWLERFIDELASRHALGPGEVGLEVSPQVSTVRMDQSQLHQVLWNLCENALRYSRGLPRLELKAGMGDATQRPYLDVVDHGPGIREEDADHVFEPFFSRDSTGTGLGLYIARELCESNQASLSLHANGPGGCCFRINFAHPNRQQVTAA